MRRAILLSALLVSLSVPPALARTITVGPGGGYDYLTIQPAIDAVTTGDTIVVYPDTYSENVSFKGRSIILRSTNPTSASIVDQTIIDGHTSGTVVTFAGTENSSCVLSGFNLRNGGFPLPNALPGGNGIRGNGTLALIENNFITQNDCEAPEGAGINQCDGVIRNNVISHNFGGGSGGLYQCDGIIEYNIILDNTVGPAQGGSALNECQGVIRGNMIARNGGGQFGAALYRCSGLIENNVVQSSSDGTGLLECGGTIRDNLIAGNLGYGLSRCPGTIQNNLIAGNGMGIWDCAGTIRDNTVAANITNGLYTCGGAIVNCIIWGERRRGCFVSGFG